MLTFDVVPLGASSHGDGSTSFLVWAPAAERVEVVVGDGRVVALDAGDRGHHHAVVEDVGAGARYRYRLCRGGDDPVERADPASGWQPDGVHGPSAVDDPSAFTWTDHGWCDRPLWQHLLYELHVGTFTPDGTFDAIVPRLDDLADTGITAIELMPVAQFPGGRNWGYDGVLPYAVQDSYGGPDGLRRLVDAAHAKGIAVILDVVYNHLGPEGNHLADFGPYFTDRHRTPWGDAVNFDDAGSDEVRRFVVDNAVRWVRDFHLDGLRLDAVHAIYDQSATHVLEQLTAAVHAEGERQGRRVHVVAESDLNDARLVRATEVGGYGLDAQWNDDVHHALHALLTTEDRGYYADYGRAGDLARAYADRFVFAGRRSAFRRRRHGATASDVPHQRFVVCAQNHDQVGNRMVGDRLTALVDFERHKLAAFVVLLSPFVPLLFMGEEYGDTAPFPYFVSHTDAALAEAVRAGRRSEFASFAWQGDPPDPQDPDTFAAARLDWSLRAKGDHATLLALYRELARLRRTLTAIADPQAGEPDAEAPTTRIMVIRRACGDGRVAQVVNFGDAEVEAAFALPEGDWRVRLDTADRRWSGNGPQRPDAVRSDGRLTLRLAATSAVLLHDVAGDTTT